MVFKKLKRTGPVAEEYRSQARRAGLSLGDYMFHRGVLLKQARHLGVKVPPNLEPNSAIYRRVDEALKRQKRERRKRIREMKRLLEG